MEFLGDGVRRALALLFSGDAEVYGVAVLTLRVPRCPVVFAFKANAVRAF